MTIQRRELAGNGRTPLESVLHEFKLHCDRLFQLSRLQSDALQDDNYDHLLELTERKDAVWSRAAVLADQLQELGVSFGQPNSWAGPETLRDEIAGCASLLTRVQAVERFNLRTAIQHEQVVGHRLGELVVKRSVMKRYGGAPHSQHRVNFQR
ncbi:flagellar export chaperone FlgN [candidate division KSB1 bacterium]|nr:flagellar export chaperone FlgN [candidate division KSB1 bacterium]